MITNIVESGPSSTARLLNAATRSTLRTALHIGSHTLHLPWPYGAIELAARALPKHHGSSTTVQLPNAKAELVHARGVTHIEGRVILYIHGGAFILCGTNTHGDLITRLSAASNAPVLAVNYRMIPKHSIWDAIQDCIDAYDWLRQHYPPERIVVAGDSAGGYLTMALATHLGPWEQPAALVMLSPLLQLDPAGKKAHPNMQCDAMFTPQSFDALITLVTRASGGIAPEPLDFLSPDIPPTLIHASGHEVLLHDARLAAERLHARGVDVEVHVWPGQIHDFQLASFVPEARQSLRQIGEFVIARTSQNGECNTYDLTLRTESVG